MPSLTPFPGYTAPSPPSNHLGGFNEGKDSILVKELGANIEDHQASVHVNDDLEHVVRQENEKYGHEAAVEVSADALQLEDSVFD